MTIENVCLLATEETINVCNEEATQENKCYESQMEGLVSVKKSGMLKNDILLFAFSFIFFG